MRPPQPRTLVIGAALGLVVVAGTGAGLALARDGSGAASPAAPADTSVTVARGRLDQKQLVTGALGYGPPTTVSGRGSGTVTWLPSGGTTVGRGHQLYRADDRPVVLLYGALPLYRTLTSHPKDPDEGGSHDGDVGDGGDGGDGGDAGKDAPPPPVALLRGSDVDLVAANLAALGLYHGPTSGVSYGWALASAVQQWQKSLGEEPSGVIEPGDVVVAPGQVRVDGVTAHLGDDVQQPILTVTSTVAVVTLQAPVDLAGSLKDGRRVPVKLPDGRTVPTRIESIGTASGGEDGGEPSVPIVVRPVHADALRGVALGPVSAQVVTASVADALHLPVAALLALSGGGYAVELPDHTLTPVTIGMVADGEVQVTGVEAGTQVVVAR